MEEQINILRYETRKKVIDVNLNGMFLTNTAAGRQMLKQGHGSIINTASMSAHIVNVPQPQCAYNASKAGVIQLTKSLAVDASPFTTGSDFVIDGAFTCS